MLKDKFAIRGYSFSTYTPYEGFGIITLSFTIGSSFR